MVEEARLENLKIENRNTKVGKGYSWFVKTMRVVLPLIAIALTFIVIVLPKMKDQLVIVPKETLVQPTNSNIGANELLNPNFETIDSNKNPVKVTATRALQNQENPNLLKLENPQADLKMKDGSDVDIQAVNGAYEQETEKLFLTKDVIIKHASGYQLNAEELRIDMKTKEAFSDKNVTINGPAAKIEATGLEGNVDNGILTFKGPAKMTLKSSKNKQQDRQQNKEQGDGI